jgi:hypothetical protein
MSYLAAEAIGEEVWRDPKKQTILKSSGGIEALVAICANVEEAIESLLPSIWSLRNALHNNPEAKTIFEQQEGIVTTLSVISRCLTGKYTNQSERMLEACLTLLSTAIINDSRNARKLLVTGLEVVMDLADGKLAAAKGVDDTVKRALKAEGVIALANSILQVLGPYNYVVCRHCSRKQDLRGTHCLNCGYTLLVDVSHKLSHDDLQATKSLQSADKSGLNAQLLSITAVTSAVDKDMSAKYNASIAVSSVMSSPPKILKAAKRLPLRQSTSQPSLK